MPSQDGSSRGRPAPGGSRKRQCLEQVGLAHAAAPVSPSPFDLARARKLPNDSLTFCAGDAEAEVSDCAMDCSLEGALPLQLPQPE